MGLSISSNAAGADRPHDGWGILPRQRRPWPLIISIFAGYTGTAVLSDALPPILPRLAMHFGGGEAGQLTAQMVATIPYFGLAVSGLLAGLLIERLGIKAVLLASLVAFALFGSVGFVLDSALSFLLTRLVLGMATGIMITCGMSLIAINYSGIDQSRMTGLMYAINAICAATFVMVSAGFASLSWRAPFALHGLVALLFLLPAVMIRRSSSTIGRRPSAAQDGRLRQLQPLLPNYLILFAVVLVGNLFNTQMSFLVADIGLADPNSIASIFLVVAVTIAVTNLSYGRIEAKIGVNAATISSWVAVLVGAIICGGAESRPILASGVVIGCAGIGIIVPAMASVVMHRTAPGFAPRALGLATSTMYFGGSIGPVVYAPIRFMFGLRGTYYVSALVIGAALLAYGLWFRKGEVNGQDEDSDARQQQSSADCRDQAH